MNRKIIYTIIAGILLIVCYFSFRLGVSLTKDTRFEKNKYKEYLWLFKKSEIKNLDKLFCWSRIHKEYVYTSFNYKHLYNISVWEFFSLKSINLESISIDTTKKFAKEKFNFTSGFDSKANPRIMFNYDFDFEGKMQIDIDKGSETSKSLEGLNYKGLYYSINRMIIGNGEKNLILYDYLRGKVSTLLILYKNSKGFFVIIVEPQKGLVDPDIINIFNLE